MQHLADKQQTAASSTWRVLDRHKAKPLLPGSCRELPAPLSPLISGQMCGVQVSPLTCFPPSA